MFFYLKYIKFALFQLTSEEMSILVLTPHRLPPLPLMKYVKPKLKTYNIAAMKFRIVPLMGLTTLDELRCGEGVPVVEVGEPPTTMM